MIRIGCFTGRVYGVDYGTNTIEECCVVFNGTEATNGKNIDIVRERSKTRCEGCYGCPEAKKELAKQKKKKGASRYARSKRCVQS